VLAACAARPQAPPLTDSHVLSLDPIDASSPALELIGLSSQTAVGETNLTIEFLDLSRETPPQLVVGIDLWPGFSSDQGPDGRWNLLLRLTPSETNILNMSDDMLVSPDRIHAEWNYELDQVAISLPFPGSSSSPPFTIKVEARQADSPTAGDVIGPVLSDARDLRAANLVLVFWDTFRGETAALAQRSWDGAHGGPAGERFGLSHLLVSSRRHGIRLNLLDLNDPTALAGLDFLGKASELEAFIESGLIYLPSTLPDDYRLAGHPPEITRALLSDRSDVSSAYHMSTSSWVALDSPQLNYEDLRLARELGFGGVIAPLDPALGFDRSGWITRYHDVLVIPRPLSETELSAGYDGGLGLALRRSLVEAATSGDNAGLLLLGGSLPQTFWGDPGQVESGFAWIAAHSWVNTLTLDETAHLPVAVQPPSLPRAGSALDLDPDPPGSPPPAYAASGRNSIERMAVDLYARASSMRTCLQDGDVRLDDAWAVCDRALAGSINMLRRLALADVALLDYAAGWGRNAACNPANAPARAELLDLDQDGRQEAALWDSNLLAVFDPVGGRLNALFGCVPGYGITTLIGPRAFEVIGLSDPSTWIFEQDGIGERGDPLLAGAFTSTTDANLVFDLVLVDDAIRLIHPGGQFKLTFSLSGSTLQAEFESEEKARRRLELGFLVAPERMDFPGFSLAYGIDHRQESLDITVAPGPHLQVRLPSSIWEVDSFLDSPAPEMNSEDPNVEVTQGHFLPLPFIRVRGWISDDEQISISLPSDG